MDAPLPYLPLLAEFLHTSIQAKMHEQSVVDKLVQDLKHSFNQPIPPVGPAEQVTDLVAEYVALDVAVPPTNVRRYRPLGVGFR